MGTKKVKKKKWIIFSALILTLLVFVSYCRIGNNVKMHPGNITVPQERTITWNTTSVFYDSIVASWAPKTVEYGKKKGKVSNPRILLARLHSKFDIPETNKLILNMIPWGVSGSEWPLNKLGDYDFTFTVLTSILWQFGDKPEILYPETVEHLLNVLLVEDGNKFRRTAPKTLGLAPETENHILMTEGSRYLKNRWIRLHGNDDPYFDNISNGMEDKILEGLEEMQANGLYEFNSMPYIGYTITALLNLEAYSSEKVCSASRAVLDYMNFCYALGSYHYQYFPPMRRRYERASWHELTTGYHSVFMKAWMSFLPGTETNYDIGQGQAHALMGACMPYRPADEITKLLFEKEDGYFIKLGHGKKACPEIYSAGKDFLLSSGGTNRGKWSQIVTRPITLFVNNNATNLKHTFHLYGPGNDFFEWNNTGVYKNFACTAGKVNIPEGLTPDAKNNDWSVYKLEEELGIAVYSSDTLGILALFEDKDPKHILQGIIQANANIEELKTQFQFPEGPVIQYDVYAPEDKWVITKVDNTELDRDFDDWPLISGDYK